MYVNVKDYSAVGDGMTNDTAAINAAIAAANEGETLYFPAGVYATDASVVINKEVNVMMEGTIRYAGSGNIAVLSISKGSGNAIAGRQLVLRATRSNVADWTSENSVSIQLVNIYQSDITIVDASASTIGLQCLADNKGFVYNVIKLLNIGLNKVGLDLASVNSGWCSENLYLGGRIWNSSDSNLNKDRYGIRIRSVDNSYNSNGNNVFQKPNFEMSFHNLTGGAEAVPIVITGGRDNYFYNCRVEDCSDTMLRDAIQHNHITIGYRDSTVCALENTAADRWGSTIQDLSSSGFTEAREITRYQVFDSGMLAKRAAYYAQGDWGGHYLVHVPGMCHVAGYDGALHRAYYGVICNDYLDADGFIGVFVKTDEAKHLAVLREYFEEAQEDRFIVRCYDADMNIIDGSSANYVKSSYYGFYWNAAYNAYVLGTSEADDTIFRLDNAVKYVFIGCTGCIRSFSIYADKAVAAYSPYDTADQVNAGTEIPAIGTHTAGRRLANAAPAMGSPKAWVCTVSGTNDTINTTCTANGTAVVAVASAAGLDAGQWISIHGGAALQIVKIDGLSITMSDTVASGSGISFVNSPSVWVSEGLLEGAGDPVYRVFASGSLFRRAHYCGEPGWSGHDHVGVPGMLYLDTSSAALCKTFWSSICNRYVNISGCIGVMVRTDAAKNFLLSREFLNSAEADRIAVRCFDEDMNLLDGTSTQYAVSHSMPFYWSASVDAFWLADDDSGDILFTVTDAVKYIFVGARGKLRSMVLYADTETTVYSPYDNPETPAAAVAAPVIGTHLAGDRLGNAAPSAGNPKGWMCTASGTNDTISTTCTANGTAVVAVASADGLDIGQFISVNSAAALRIVKIDGLSITMSGTVASGSGLSFVNAPAAWASEGNL